VVPNGHKDIFRKPESPNAELYSKTVKHPAYYEAHTPPVLFNKRFNNDENWKFNYQVPKTIELNGNPFKQADPHLNSRPLFTNQGRVNNGTPRNTVPFLPSKSSSPEIKAETAEEADKIKKLQRSLATLTITQEIKKIMEKVQAKQRTKLEDWFANLAPMHLANMERFGKKDRDRQVKSLRSSFADNGKFLSGMLVDRLLEDAKIAIMKKCEDGVRKLLDSIF